MNEDRKKRGLANGKFFTAGAIGWQSVLCF